MKNGDALNIEWNVPLLFAGNWLPDYLDKGQVSRRLVVFNFAENVYEPDSTLQEKILVSELPGLIMKCAKLYNELILKKSRSGLGTWQIVPEYFLEQQIEMKMERNPLFKYLTENSRYLDGNEIKLIEVREKFAEWLGSKVRGLDHGTFGQVDKRYKVESVKICKFCKGKHLKNCCGNYESGSRSSQSVIVNMMLM